MRTRASLRPVGLEPRICRWPSGPWMWEATNGKEKNQWEDSIRLLSKSFSHSTVQITSTVLGSLPTGPWCRSQHCHLRLQLASHAVSTEKIPELLVLRAGTWELYRLTWKLRGIKTWKAMLSSATEQSPSLGRVTWEVCSCPLSTRGQSYVGSDVLLTYIY